MYVPHVFEERDPEQLCRLVRRHPLGTLVTVTADGLEADHIPFLISGDGATTTLHGHVARANPAWQHLARHPQVLVVFQGPDTFVSPSYYPSKREHGKVVPTWNYAVVHAHGTARDIDDVSWLRTHVDALTNEHETGREAPWAVGDAPADFVDKLLNAIVGIEISITRLTGKWKVSQNRSVPDRLGVIEGLDRDKVGSNPAMAALMRATLDGDG
jgi:transcriptional regulator